MWPMCVICAFSFYPARPGDVERICEAIESHYGAAGQPAQPWSETAGPFVDVKIVLLARDWGVADATLTWIGVFGVRSELRRAVIAKNSGEWRVLSIGP